MRCLTEVNKKVKRRRGNVDRVVEEIFYFTLLTLSLFSHPLFPFFIFLFQYHHHHHYYLYSNYSLFFFSFLFSWVSIFSLPLPLYLTLFFFFFLSSFYFVPPSSLSFQYKQNCINTIRRHIYTIQTLNTINWNYTYLETWWTSISHTKLNIALLG